MLEGHCNVDGESVGEMAMRFAKEQAKGVGEITMLSAFVPACKYMH